ncbi:MAG: monovalent cation/H+ antiporter subunit D family protein [bacterium]
MIETLLTLQLPILIILAPLFAGFLTFGIGSFNKKLCAPITIVGTGLSLICAIQVLSQVQQKGPVHYFLGGWIPPIGIEYVVDHLNGMVLVLIAVVAFLTAIYSVKVVEKELSKRIHFFYTLFLFLVTGLMGITITGDAFNVYVLIEIAALSSYALLALGQKKSFFATFNYLIIGTIGACLYLLGVGFLLIQTGTLNMPDLAYQITLQPYSAAIFIAFILMVCGMFVKMAFFPAHGWLANAYASAPTAVGCLIAPLMTKVSVYVVIRVLFSIFSVSYVFDILNISNAVIVLAVAAIVVGSIYALMQQHFRKLCCYLIVAEIGYMMGGIFMGNANGFFGGTYHLIADALMTAALFMVAGAIYYKQGTLDIRKWAGLFKKMPITMTCFIFVACSMIGIPPTAGFFSKWYLISGALQAGHYLFMIALLFSSLINAVLFFRIIEYAYFGSFSSPNSHSQERSEAPLSMLLPLVLVIICMMVLGLYSQDILKYFIAPINPFLGN